MVLVALKSPRARQYNVLQTSTRKNFKRSELINLAIIISVEQASLHRGSGATGIANLTFKGRKTQFLSQYRKLWGTCLAQLTNQTLGKMSHGKFYFYYFFFSIGTDKNNKVIFNIFKHVHSWCFCSRQEKFPFSYYRQVLKLKKEKGI